MINARAIVYAVNRLVQLLLDGQFGEVPNSTGIVWSACEDLQKFPLSNKAAYRRALLEVRASIACLLFRPRHTPHYHHYHHLVAQFILVNKDTCEEFTEALNQSMAAGTRAEAEDATGKQDDDDGSDGLDGYEGNYTESERPVAAIALEGLQLCMDVFKATLDTASTVGDRLVGDSSANMQRWTEECHQLASHLSDAMTDLGAELYSPIDMEATMENLHHVTLLIARLIGTLLGDICNEEGDAAAAEPEGKQCYGTDSKEESAGQESRKAVIVRILSQEQVDVLTACVDRSADIMARFRILTNENDDSEC